MRPSGVFVRAEDWQVQSVPTHGEAVRFMRDHHYARGAANTSTYRHGMYEVGDGVFVGSLVGVAMWMPPTRVAAESVAGENWQGVLCLSRLAIAPHVGTNGASFLLGRSMRLIDRSTWPILLTYADTSRGHRGQIYKATNWTCMGEVDAGITWSDPDGRQWGRKRGPRTLTDNEMRDLGLTPNHKAKKIKFVHYTKGYVP